MDGPSERDEVESYFNENNTRYELYWLNLVRNTGLQQNVFCLTLSEYNIDVKRSFIEDSEKAFPGLTSKKLLGPKSLQLLEW